MSDLVELLEKEQKEPEASADALVAYIYDVLRIEKRKDNTFWVLDKRAPNALVTGPFQNMEEAQEEWSQQAEGIKAKGILPAGSKIYFVVVRQRDGVREYLKTYATQSMKESEKWSSDRGWADRFLVPDGARKVGQRILGHEEFTVEVF